MTDMEVDDWSVEGSDDEKYNPDKQSDKPWEPSAKSIMELYSKLSKGESLCSLDWKSPGRLTPPEDRVELKQEVKEEFQDDVKNDANEVTEFDFEDEEDISTKITPRRTPGSAKAPRSAQRKVASLDKIMLDMRRHKQAGHYTPRLPGMQSRARPLGSLNSSQNRLPGLASANRGTNPAHQPDGNRTQPIGRASTTPPARLYGSNDLAPVSQSTTSISSTPPARLVGSADISTLQNNLKSTPAAPTVGTTQPNKQGSVPDPSSTTANSCQTNSETSAAHSVSNQHPQVPVTCSNDSVKSTTLPMSKMIDSPAIVAKTQSAVPPIKLVLGKSKEEGKPSFSVETVPPCNDHGESGVTPGTDAAGEVTKPPIPKLKIRKDVIMSPPPPPSQ